MPCGGQVQAELSKEGVTNQRGRCGRWEGAIWVRRSTGPEQHNN
ncbi:hypothetical protein E2C01_047045 [Portunus trituberculatus]|uniref:Uncharacterized protein n=1 Tax=Portunus trituberculatus TaxID=210409 RepID=A0A5B7G6D8_PORTR|nr:hypothetical protein [Portunus trituberculatus]